MITNMIERLTLAIENVQSSAKSTLVPAEHRNQAAVAALRALRDPTPEMVEAMNAYATWDGIGEDDIVMTYAWQAGIDAALREEKSP